MIINIKKNQLKSNITYNFVTIDKNEESKNWYNADDRNENDSTLPGLFITFLDKDYDKNDAYIHFIAKNEKQNIESGTNAIQLAIRLCKYLNVRYAYLEDDSKIKCEMPRDLSLTLFKLLTTGNTWYEKHGFKFDVKKYNHIKLAIKKVQNIKIIDVIKTVKNIRDALQNTIKSGKYSEFKCWSPFVSEIAIHRSKWLSNKYELYANIYLLLNKNKKKGDTLKSYSNRVAINNCKDYIETVQKLLFNYGGWNNSEHMLVINYKNKWINYPFVKELYLVNILIHNWNVKYKRKIR